MASGGAGGAVGAAAATATVGGGGSGGDVAIHIGSAGVAARGGKGTPNWRPAPPTIDDDDDDKYRRRGGIFHSLFGRPAGAKGLSMGQGVALFACMAIAAIILVVFAAKKSGGGAPPDQ